MKVEDYLSYALPTDIPETYQPVISLIGLENFCKLCDYYRGEEVYFPVAEYVFKKTRNRMILQEFDGHNTKALAKKYGITTVQVRNIVNGSKLV